MDWDDIKLLYIRYGVIDTWDNDTIFSSVGCSCLEDFIIIDDYTREPTCTRCGVVTNRLIGSGVVPDKNFMSNYNPRFHSHERIRMACGQGTHVPDEELDEIYKTLIQTGHWGKPVEGIPFSARARRRIKEVLSTLNAQQTTRYWSKWLEQWPQIVDRLTDGLPLPRSLPAYIYQLDILWNQMVEAWIKTKPPDRKHLPNTAYLILRLCEFIGQGEEVAPWFPQLLTINKIARNEMYWKRICEYNNWPFTSLFYAFYEDHYHIRPWTQPEISQLKGNTDLDDG